MDRPSQNGSGWRNAWRRGEGTCGNCKVWEGTFDYPEEAVAGLDAATTSGDGRCKGKRSKASKRAKVEVEDKQQNDSTTGGTAASPPGRSLHRGIAGPLTNSQLQSSPIPDLPSGYQH